METNIKEQMNFQVIDYSEKSIALVGNTKEIKDKLKKLGGRFNSGLSCGAGWVFAKTKQKDLEKLLVKINKSTVKAQDNITNLIADRFTTAKTKLDSFTNAQVLLASMKKDKKAEQIIYNAMMWHLLAYPNATEEELLSSMYKKLKGE